MELALYYHSFLLLPLLDLRGRPWSSFGLLLTSLSASEYLIWASAFLAHILLRFSTSFTFFLAFIFFRVTVLAWALCCLRFLPSVSSHVFLHAFSCPATLVCHTVWFSPFPRRCSSIYRCGRSDSGSCCLEKPKSPCVPFLYGKTLPPMTSFLKEQTSANISPLSFIPPRPCFRITVSEPALLLHTLALKSPINSIRSFLVTPSMTPCNLA